MADIHSNANSGTNGVKRFQFPEVGERKLLPTNFSREQERQAALAMLQAQAQQAGYDAGYAEGRAKIEAELQPIKAQLQQIVTVLSQPLYLVERHVEDALLQLVLQTARHIICRELTTQPTHIHALLKEVLQHLPPHLSHCVLMLHPDDMQLVQSLQENSDEEIRQWLEKCERRASPQLQRGECQLMSDSLQIDATFETRLKQIIETWWENSNV